MILITFVADLENSDLAKIMRTCCLEQIIPYPSRKNRCVEMAFSEVSRDIAGQGGAVV